MNYIISLTEEQESTLTRELSVINAKAKIENPDAVDKTKEEYLQELIDNITNSWRRNHTEYDLNQMKTYGEWLLKLPENERNTFIQDLTLSAQQNGII